MIETYIDFVSSSDLRLATTKANEQIKTNDKAGWTMIQCQLLESSDEFEIKSFTYSMVYQRTKEKIVGNYATEEQSARAVSLVDKSEAR
jgi:hypothetical protein